MRKLLALLLASACFSVMAAADDKGPFGVRMGMQKQEIEQSISLTPDPGRLGHYSSTDAPIKNRAFSLYEYVISDVAGLCQVKAWTDKAALGVTNSVYQQIYKHLRDRYGEPTRPDVGGTALWHRQPLPNQIASIGIQAITDKAGISSFVYIVYSFENLSSCGARPQVDGTGL